MNLKSLLFWRRPTQVFMDDYKANWEAKQAAMADAERRRVSKKFYRRWPQAAGWGVLKKAGHLWQFIVAEHKPIYVNGKSLSVDGYGGQIKGISSSDLAEVLVFAKNASDSRRIDDDVKSAFLNAALAEPFDPVGISTTDRVEMKSTRQRAKEMAGSLFRSKKDSSGKISLTLGEDASEAVIMVGPGMPVQEFHLAMFHIRAIAVLERTIDGLLEEAEANFKARADGITGAITSVRATCKHSHETKESILKRVIEYVAKVAPAKMSSPSNN